MSFKILFLALMLSLIMAISGIVSGAGVIGQNSISFDTASWCAIPVFNVPSSTDLVPEIHIRESHSNTATSWSISIGTIFKFPQSSNPNISAITAVPVTVRSPDRPEIITSSADTDASNTLPSFTESIDITPTDPTADTSDGSSLILDVDSITVDPSPFEPETENSESGELSITLMPSDDSMPTDPIEPTPLAVDVYPDFTYEPEDLGFPTMAQPSQDIMMIFQELADRQMELFQAAPREDELPKETL